MKQNSFAACLKATWFVGMLVSLMFVVFPTGASAQGGGNVAITGTVMDPSGAIIPAAKVTVTEKSTGVSRTAITNGSGQFNISSLPPGTYTVNIKARGFSQSVQTFTLLADQVRDLNVRLQVGSASQQVTVEASTVAVNTVSPVLSHVMEQSRVINLPLNGRNPADLTVLVPGANFANGHGTQQGDTKQIPGAESISVNGARPDQISYNLDGANNQDMLSNTNNPFPFPDALQEFSVQTNNFSVQYGGNAGAVVNVVTKSGTNNWHGDLFEFVRNGAFNARNYFADKVDPLKRNQFGGVIGGPIHKDKSFIFFGYQGTIIRSQNNASNATIPTPAELKGDFSALCTGGFDGSGNCLKGKQIYNPYTGVAFPNNQINIPLSPVALAMTKYLPIAQEASDGTVTYATLIHQNFNEEVGRFDQVLRNQDHLFVRALIDKYTHAPTFDGTNILTVHTGATVDTDNIALGYTTVFSPSLVNNVVVDVVRAWSDRNQGGKVPQLSDFGASIKQLPKAQGGIRGFGVSGYWGTGDFTDAVFARNSGNIRDHVMWLHGKHSFDFGFDFERDQSNIDNTDLMNGTFSFTSDTNPGSNDAEASFMMGYLRSMSQTSGDYSNSRENVIGFFAGDTWKMSPRFTLDLGLRYAPQVPMKEIYGRIQQFRPDAYKAGVSSSVIPSAPPGLFFVGDKYNGISVPATGETGDFNNFAPRVGFALDPHGNGKMSIRGGGGVFYYTRLPGLFLNDASIVAPFSLRIDPVDPDVGPLSNPLVNYPSFTAAFPERYTLKTAPKNVAFPAIVAVYGLTPGISWITPTIYDWNFTVQRQLRSDTLFSASYVGLRGNHLRQDTDLNPGQYISGSKLSLQQRRPFQPFGDIIQNANTGASGYNAMQLSISKRPSTGAGFLHPIMLSANYTLAKAKDYGLNTNGGITDVGSSKGSGMSIYDPRQHAFETGFSDFDRRNRVVASFVWNLPGLARSNGLVRTVAGGWVWSGIYDFETGDPLTIGSGKDQSQSGLGGDRADYIGPAGDFGQMAPSGGRGGCSASVKHCVAFLDTSWFTQPAVGTYGDVGKNTFRGPSDWNVDSGLYKNFHPIPSDESFRIQFRGEFFNLFNHTELQDPSSTVSSSSFGSIRAANDPRIIQLALKLFF
ncbi:MAG TPA: carboxypeptidase regulatory-like domain-containing protein [Terracidiphilus sp.]|nr:carboxypeptidase regulatory-like domain-containing protein [Terracidiphilus sp.]